MNEELHDYESPSMSQKPVRTFSTGSKNGETD